MRPLHELVRPQRSHGITSRYLSNIPPEESVLGRTSTRTRTPVRHHFSYLDPGNIRRRVTSSTPDVDNVLRWLNRRTSRRVLRFNLFLFLPFSSNRLSTALSVSPCFSFSFYFLLSFLSLSYSVCRYFTLSFQSIALLLTEIQPHSTIFSKIPLSNSRGATARVTSIALIRRTPRAVNPDICRIPTSSRSPVVVKCFPISASTLTQWGGEVAQFWFGSDTATLIFRHGVYLVYMWQPAKFIRDIGNYIERTREKEREWEKKKWEEIKVNIKI